MVNPKQPTSIETTKKDSQDSSSESPDNLVLADKDLVDELSQHGVDYRYETTKNYFPYPVGGDRYNPAKIGYVIPSRPVDEGKQIEYEEDGNTYIGIRKMALNSTLVMESTSGAA